MEHSAIETYLTNEFYWFHQHPELSYEEFATTAHIREALTKAHIRILDLPLPTGLIAEIGTGKAPVIALRGDIDGLPVQEQTGLPYRSQAEGKMHACGHDFHTTAVLGAALLLKEHETQLPGTVRILFQPAEEAPGGAKKVLETGLLDEVEALFGLHSSPLFPVGTAAFHEGAVTAAVDRFNISFHGKGTHAAHPQQGIDPIICTAAFVSAVQTIVSRNVDPFAADLISITHIEGGNTWNVIPESAFVEGTTRSLQPADRTQLKTRLFELAEHTAKAYGCTAKIQWFAGPPATANAAEWTSLARDEAAAAGFTLADSPASLGGEDFAYFQEKIPGTFFQIGTGLSYSNHNPQFKVDPAALLPTARYMAQLARRALQKLQPIK